MDYVHKFKKIFYKTSNGVICKNYNLRIIYLCKKHFLM